MSIPEIMPEEARNRLANGEGYIYLDVRTVPEYHQGHVPGSLNVPVALVDAVGQMVPNPAFLAVVTKVVPRDAKVIVGCRSGGRSAAAVQMMQELGYPHAVNLQGGFHGKTDITGQVLCEGWESLGYPVARGDEQAIGYEELQSKAAEA